jgi:hypothetical protein
MRSFIRYTPHRYGGDNRRILATFRVHREIVSLFITELLDLGQWSDLLSHRIPHKQIP